MTRSTQPHPSRLPVTTRRTLLSLAGAGLATALARPAWAADGMRPAAAQAPTLTAFDRQIIGQVDIDGETEAMTVSLCDMKGEVLYRKELTPTLR